MKKLTKNSLAEMADLLPELDAEDQKCILGGTASTSLPPDYTGTIPEPTVTTTPVDPYAVSESMPTATTSTAAPTTTTTTAAPTGNYSLEELARAVCNYTGVIYVDSIPTQVSDSTTVDNGSIIPITYEDLGQFSSVIGLMDDLSGGVVKNLGNFGQALGYIDLAHQAITLYNEDGGTSYDQARFYINLGLALGGTAGALVGVTWKTLDVMTKDFQEQGKDWCIRFGSTLGKDGNYSFYRFEWGY